VNKSTKADIVDAIYEKTSINRKEIYNVVDLFIEEIKAALVSQKVIELRGFGTFEIRIRKGRRKARNPKTGETIAVHSHGIAAFRPGKELKQDVWNLRLPIFPRLNQQMWNRLFLKIRSVIRRKYRNELPGLIRGS